VRVGHGVGVDRQARLAVEDALSGSRRIRHQTVRADPALGARDLTVSAPVLLVIITRPIDGVASMTAGKSIPSRDEPAAFLLDAGEFDEHRSDRCRW